uniref:Uncharacterized protein n=1 Tax=Arundo donax TaxID=35708 RepID=A0A0A9G857_ARUDO
MLLTTCMVVNFASISCCGTTSSKIDRECVVLRTLKTGISCKGVQMVDLV